MEKVWLVTGAGKGFGLEITKAAINAGNKVIATVRNNGAELAAAFNNTPDLLVVNMDVTDEGQVNEAVQKGMAYFGRIDILVNNAGFGLVSSVEEATDEEARKQFDTNVFGVLNVIRAVLPFMRKQGFGHVINISALFVFGTIPGWGIYSASKHAIEGISEGLALELAPLGIYVTVVEPGMFTTNFLDGGSFIQSENEIGDYKNTAGQIRSLTSQFNGTQPGDPQKFGQALIKLINAKSPPVHLPLGKDCIEFYNKNKELRETEMEKWMELTLSTDHEKLSK